MNPLIDVPTGKTDCSSLFWAMLKRAPEHIDAKQHSKGSHGGRGTNWAGAYTTFEIYDTRRPDWPTQDAEDWGERINVEICAHLQQVKIR